MKRALIIFFSLVSLAGCAQPSGGGSAAAVQSGPKALLSNWKMQYGAAYLDLSQIHSGNNQVAYPFINGNMGDSNNAICQCMMNISGSNDSGTFTLASCAYQPGTGSGNPLTVYPMSNGCTSRNGNYTYARVDVPSEITICDAALTACNIFQ